MINVHSASAALVLFLICGCARDSSVAPPPPAPSTATTTQPVASNPAGEWSGNATIVVNWVKQRNLPIAVTIAPDGSVTGTVGDAQLVDARLRAGRGPVLRSLGWARDYRIHGKLQGDILKDEQVQRDEVDIVFDRSGDGKLVGGAASSGSEIGDKGTMKLTAGNMVLTQKDSSAGAAAEGNTPPRK